MYEYLAYAIAVIAAIFCRLWLLELSRHNKCIKDYNKLRDVLYVKLAEIQEVRDCLNSLRRDNENM